MKCYLVLVLCVSPSLNNIRGGYIKEFCVQILLIRCIKTFIEVGEG